MGRGRCRGVPEPRHEVPAVSRVATALIAASLLLVTLASTAAAKCENPQDEETAARCQAVVANLDIPGGFRAGNLTTIGVWIYQAEQPFDATRVQLIFTRIADGTTLRYQTRPSGEPGRWLADVELPAGGGWTVTAEWVGVNGYSGNVALDTLRIRDPLPAPANPTPTTPTNAPAPIPVLPWLIVAVAALAGLAGIFALGRRRRAATA